MRIVRGLGSFFYDFIFGDDWRIAAGVVTVLIIGGARSGSADWQQ